MNDPLPFDEMIESVERHIKEARYMLQTSRDRKCGIGYLADWMLQKGHLLRDHKELLRLVARGSTTPEQVRSFRELSEKAIEELIVGYDQTIKLLTLIREVERRMEGAGEDELATCHICGKSRHENDVNLTDYEDDVCILCETEYLREREKTA